MTEPQVVYAAPNRAHHYTYAKELVEAGLLSAFVTGYSRFAKHASLPEIESRLHRADFLQNIYIASLKMGLPKRLSHELAHLSKCHIDLACARHLRTSNIFVGYNGCGLHTIRLCKKRIIISIVEAVNSHVEFQEEILREEHGRIGIPWTPFHGREKRRRIEEYEESDYILVPSQFVRSSFLAKGFAPERILKVPYRVRTIPGSDNNSSLPVENAGDSFRILYVGAISVRKGLRYLIEAFAKFQHPRKELLIVGPQSSPSGLDGLSIPDGVTFAGVLKGEALANVYRSASVFCLPTLEEGLALVLAEAIGNGLPVIATENSGASDLITDGKEGVILRIRDVDAIATALQRAADEPGWLQGMREAARLRMADLLTESQGPSPLVQTLKSLFQ